jgi:putative membrane protein
MQLIQNEQRDPQFVQREWLKTAILLGMCAYLALLMLSGNINNYMNQRFQWLVVVAIVMFGLMGVWNLRQMLQKPAQHTLDNNLNISHDGHNHTLISWQAIAVVSIPLLFAVLLPSTPLGASAVTGGISLNGVGVGSASTLIRDPQDRNILDWLREFNRVENPASFNDQAVNVIGFVYREPYMNANQFMVARFTMSCCVADAFAIGIPLESDTANTYETGAWIQVKGILQAGMFGDNQVPIIQPTNIQETDVPSTPYLYP